MLLDLPASLDNEEKKIIMQDYDRAKIHITSVLTLKMSHWNEAPFFIFGIGHYDKSKALACYRRAMGHSPSHPLIAELQSERFARDRALYEELEGHLPLTVDPSDAPHIRGFIGKVRVTPTDERAVEGTHAIVHKETRKSPNHTGALISLANRFPYVDREMLGTPESFKQFADTFASIGSARQAVELLGLGSHPSSINARDKRSKQHWRVIYRQDE